VALKLGELLIKNQIITEGQLAEALRAQHLFGGRLGTNLVELGYLSEQALTQFLSGQLNIPAVASAQLDSVPEKALTLVPRATAEKYRVVPVSVSGRKLRVAMADPTDLKAIDEVSFATGCSVQPLVAPELLITYALEKHYGIARATRYIRLTGTADAEFQVVRPSQQSADPGAGLSPEVSARVRLEERGDFLQHERRDLAQNRYGIETASKDLAATTDPKDSFEILKKFAAGDFERAAIFIVRGNRITGWEQVGSRSDPDFRQLSLPTTDQGFLQLSSQNRAAFIGSVTSPGDDWLASLLGIKRGGEIFTVPISVNNQPVSVLVATNPKHGELASHLRNYDAVATKISFALQMVYLRKRILGT